VSNICPDDTWLKTTKSLDHGASEVVDQSLAVAEVTTLDEVLALLVVAAQRRRELERPQEVVGLLEVWADSDDLVDQILHADDVVLAEVLSDQLVVGQSDALLVDLTETTLVDQLRDGLQVRLAIGDVWLNKTEHVDGSLVGLDEHGVVDLTQTQQLKDLLHARRDGVDTADTDDQQKLGLSLDEEVAVCLSNTLLTDDVLLSQTVLLDVLLSTLELLLADDTVALGNSTLLLQESMLCLLGGLALLELGLRSDDLWCCGLPKNIKKADTGLKTRS